MLSEMFRRATANKVAWAMINKPYIWGGDDPVRGFDCSGLVLEILRSVNLMPKKGDYSADAIAHYFDSVQMMYRGCLVFFLSPDKKYYSHIEYCIDDELSIGASGGGRSTLNQQDAISQNAYVKIRPVKNPALITDPFKKNPKWWIGDGRFMGID